MNIVATIKDLKEIKKSLILGAGGGVKDTCFMTASSCETIVERIESMLVGLGEDIDVLQEETEEIYSIES